MAKTLEEAKAELIAEGWPADGIPAQILKERGWVPGSLATDQNAVALTKDQLRDEFALLVAEAKANSVPGQIGGIVNRVLPTVLKLLT